jgi:predicted small lipoprotein YifL
MRDQKLAILMCLLSLIALITILAACGQGPGFLPPGAGGSVPQSHGGSVRDHVSLVDALRALGYRVEPVSEVRQPFLRVPGTVLRLSGGDLREPAEIQSYNYDDRDLGTSGLAAAQADADRLKPDGQPKTMSIAWTGPPHFFHKERVLVLYVGDDPALLGTLSNLLGPQIAGV